ncbi:MAG TPA: ABC transporter permease [Candidatus Sulfopaludibacter sp.]|jgi:predicted permease|nr:ABC transporter permease [Candidatus Sulfopaludibacter sp.]
MSWLHFLRRRHLDREVTRDLEFYIEAETDDNLARGMTPAEARAAAIRKLGNPAFIREEVYHMNTVTFFESVWQDLRQALRGLRHSPAFTATAVVSLALGIGGNTAVFTVVRGVLLKPLAYSEAGRLVKIAEFDRDTLRAETVDFTTTYDLRERNRSFQSLSLYRDASGAIVGTGEPELVKGLRVGYDFFDTLGVRMALGRAFTREEDRPETRYELILTYGLWMRRFGGDPAILGRTVRLSDSSYTVVGVLPREFPSPPGGQIPPEMYMPLGYALGGPSSCRGCQHLQLLGRLKPGVSLEQARADMSAVMRDIDREHPKDYTEGTNVLMTPLRDYVVRGVDRAMWVLLGAVGLVLLIACANVANLVLARSTVRARELALRAALGAGRLRLVRQLVLESLLLAGASAAAGMALAWWWTRALVEYAAQRIPRAGEIHMDIQVLWFTLAASLLTVMMCGVAPALRSSRVDVTESLKDMSRSTEGRGRHTMRALLVTGELALAFALVMGAGLLGKSLLRLTGVNPGYDPHNVLTLNTYVYAKRYAKPEAELNYYQQALDRLRATPGVESAAMASVLPLGSFDRRSLHVQDRHLENEAAAPSPDTYSISPDYFRVMRIPLKRGRVFTTADGIGSPKVALISESCARSVFPREDAIGKRIQLGGRHDDQEWMTIVGIVGDVRQYSLDQPSNMEAYIAQAQDVNFGYSLVARTTVDPRRLEKAAREAFYAVDATQPVFRVQPMEDYVSDTLATRRFTLMLLALFGLLALSLAGIGIYGVMSYAVSLRTREMGIRMALGAGETAVVSMVLRQGLAMAAVGIGLGAAASLGLTRFLTTLLYEVRPADLSTFAATACGLAALAVLAAYIPARRAARIDPIRALRV